MSPSTTRMGFTLAELLIALAILGVIATFTIPKILAAQSSAQNNAMAKEASGMISGAFQQAKLADVITSSTKPNDLTPYFNYVKYVTDSSVIADGYPTTTAANTCDSSSPCITLHNGGILFFVNENFSGTNTTNAIRLIFDPNPRVDGGGNGLGFVLYYDGFLTSRRYTKTGTDSSGATGMGPGAFDPTWYNW